MEHRSFGSFGGINKNVHRMKENVDSGNIKSKFHCTRFRTRKLVGIIELFCKVFEAV
jgi:hypothetical protein